MKDDSSSAFMLFAANDSMIRYHDLVSTVWFGMQHVLAEFNNSFFEKTTYKFYAFYIFWKYENIMIDSYLL